MVNERYEEEGQEEGEYHFSDDQANYDMEADASVKNSEAVAVAPKESVADKIKQHRRIVIGIVVFIILLGIVYKLVSPSNTPVTDFQTGSNVPTAAPVAASPKQTVAPNTESHMAQAPAATQQTTAVTTTSSVVTPASPVQPAPAVSPVQQPVQQPVMQTSTVSQPAVTPEEPAVGQQPPAVMTTTTTPPPPIAGTPVQAQTEKNIPDRVTTLEQQNNAIMNLMQTQYAQKIADSELQNTQLRNQVQELNARISNMEVAFRQLTKMLRNPSPAAAPRETMSAPVATRVTQPKINFTVQAIIPGRAWLKSDSGETVTVAEGDMLKGYGRITKIDPYDGIVNIDTGNRVISLAYGLSGD